MGGWGYRRDEQEGAEWGLAQKDRFRCVGLDSPHRHWLIPETLALAGERRIVPAPELRLLTGLCDRLISLGACVLTSSL